MAGIQITTFTILPGTTITLRGAFPSSHLAAAGFDRARLSTSALSAEAATSIVNLVLPLKLTGYFTVSSTRADSSTAGHSASATLPSLPRRCQNSSAMWGANGAVSRVTVSMALRLVDFCDVSSLTAIMKADIEVLKENCSMSEVTFFISLLTVLLSSRLISASDSRSVFSKSPHSFLRKRFTPSMPLVSHGLDCSTGPRNISYRRSVSAP